MKHVNLSIIGAAVVLGAFGIYQWSSVQSDGSNVGALKEGADQAEQATAVSPLIVPNDPDALGNSNVSRSSGAEASEKPNALWHSRAALEEVNRWKESRGYYSPADLEMYESYSPDTIETLAKEGDIKAIYALVDLKIAAGASQEEIVNTYLDAAALGSSQALAWAGLFATPNPKLSKYQGADGEQLYKQEMLEALSIYQAALMRGDREVLEYANEARSKVNLNPSDDEYIDKRGQEIYSKLEDIRKSRGLGAFDDSVPPVVKSYQDDAIERYKIPSNQD